MSESDPFGLQRFVDAQHGVFESALTELRRGRKTTHWMWFIFPQIAGLGHSDMARRYAIVSLAEAQAYLRHEQLGPRLRLCVEALLEQRKLSAHEIMGSPDDLKLRSSMTLFAEAVPEELLFRAALERFFEGEPDKATLERLRFD